jgi:predicted AlkP superfamily phosphohydrolase/phosphomutase
LSAGVNKVFVIGLDGATFDLAGPWAESGVLPNLARLMREGSYGQLASTIPPISAAAWASFATGVNPGKHGIYHFRQHVSGSYVQRIATGGDRHGRSLWRILSDRGRRVIVANVVMTYPPEPVNGCLLSGLDAPGVSSSYTYPPELRDDLHRVVPDYVIEPNVNQFARRSRHDVVFDNILSCLKAREEAVRYLLDSHEYDFFVVNLRATDVVQHHFWKFMDESHPLWTQEGARQFGHCIKDVYERADRIVGDLVANLADGTTVIVMSDHGFGSDSPRTVYLNRWLEEQGWLSFVGGASGKVGMQRVLGKVEQGARGVLRRVVWDFARQHAAQRFKDLLKRMLPSLANTLKSPTTYHAIAWSETVAYSDEHRSNIWINLRGREPQGIVEPGAEYESLRCEIIERLHGLRDPETGARVVEKVYRREELYPGPQTEVTPDIHIVLGQSPLYVSRPSGGAHGRGCIEHLTDEQLAGRWLINGRHRPNGILVMKGPGIRAGHQLSDASIMDLAPTILAIMGQPLLDSMDGRVLEEAFVSAPAVEYEHDDSFGESDRKQQVYSEDEAGEVEDRLRGLGYI